MEPGEDAGLRLTRFRRTLAALEEVAPRLPDVPASILRDSRIQRFEFTFESMWKLLQARAEGEGLEAPSPRKALQAALASGVIDPADEACAWEMIRCRNLTVHTYDEDLAAEVEAFVLGPGLDLFRKIASRVGPG